MRALALAQPVEAAEAFVSGIRDAEPQVRMLASAGWRKASTVPEEAIPALIEALLAASAAGIRKAAEELVEAVRPAANAILDALRGRLETEEDQEVRRFLGEALVHLKRVDNPAPDGARLAGKPNQ